MFSVLRSQPAGKPRGAADGGFDRDIDHFLRADDRHLVSGSRDARVEQLAGHDPACTLRKDDDGVVVLGTLALVDRDGVNGDHVLET